MWVSRSPQTPSVSLDSCPSLFSKYAQRAHVLRAESGNRMALDLHLSLKQTPSRVSLDVTRLQRMRCATRRVSRDSRIRGFADSLVVARLARREGTREGPFERLQANAATALRKPYISRDYQLRRANARYCTPRGLNKRPHKRDKSYGALDSLRVITPPVPPCLVVFTFSGGAFSAAR
jgi:hypothetical protein